MMKTPPEKKWKQRKRGIWQIVHKMQMDFGIRLSLYMERNGELFLYQSHDDAAWEKAVPVREALKPKNFITLAEAELTSAAQSSQALPASQRGSDLDKPKRSA